MTGPGHAPGVRVREAGDGDHAAVRRMLTAYHLTTEREKGCPVDDAARLPSAYRAEIAAGRPATGRLFLLLDDDAGAVGTYVLAPTPDRSTAELKRLWIEPAERGRGLGELALRDAVRRCADAGTGTLRLSVWEWRSAAISLYRRMGFTDHPPWDPRPGLVFLGRRTA
ncbi:GNAT family N-acetyltransferase [Geodermatophilus nigrescens]